VVWGVEDKGDERVEKSVTKAQRSLKRRKNAKKKTTFGKLRELRN